jgi:diguanylate cyclase (GGDEF)-like protein
VTRPSADHANGAPIRAVIADDTLAVRRLLMKVLSDSPLFEVVGEASDGRQAVELAAARHPDLVLIDLAMPIMGGLDAIPEITRRSPQSKIVVLSGLDAQRMGRRALERGADAFITKGLRPQQLLSSIIDAYQSALATPAETEATADGDDALRSAQEALATTEHQLQLLTAELERANTELARSNQDLLDFTAVAAHDLKSPLQVIVGFADLLDRLDGEQLSEGGRQCVTAIIDGVQRMDTLIEDLLAYSRVDAASLASDPVDLEAAIGRCLVTLAPEIDRRGAEVIVDTLPTIVSDASLIERLLLNLLSNALKFIAPHTRPRISVWAERELDGWTVTISDNGIGIDADDRTTVFRMFERVHGEERYGGTGIGLAICHRIVERHGGRIWVDDNPGGGSRFHFTLPDVTARHEAPSAERGRPAEEAAARHTDVLVVEDATADASSVASVLGEATGLHYEVRSAPSVTAALRDLHAQSADCVLLDLSLPDAKGLAAIARVHAVAPTTPIVVVTPADDDALARAALREGAQDQLTKGRFDADRLARSIRYAVKRKALDAELANDAFQDPLTHLPNEPLLLDRLGLALARARRATTSVAVFDVGLDNLGETNGFRGYQAGDEVLATVAERLAGVLRPQDTVARIRGDHFVAICEGFDAPDQQIPSVAARLLEAASRSVELRDGPVTVSACLGIARSTRESEARSLLEAAEDDLRTAKAARAQGSKR